MISTQTRMTRKYWCSVAVKLGKPILVALSTRTFKQTFVDKNNTKACLEAFARVLVGLAPWLELGEEEEAVYLADLARIALDSATDPISPDYIMYISNDQALVDTALLAQALLRAPKKLWCPLSNRVKDNIISAFRATRTLKPHDNNWVLFPSMIETFFITINDDVKIDRLNDGINLFDKWYVGDGVYGDGAEHHCDYYNSYIIHPMLYEILDVVSKRDTEWLKTFMEKETNRFQRWAIIQERSISPDGTFPPIGRSLTYRCGAFHALALCAYRHLLPDIIKPSQVRNALTLVIKTTLDNPHTFENGWLTIGLYGKQQSLAEPYINHGSVYMCSTALLPLGLPSTDPFWSDINYPITQETIRNGDTILRDRPLNECIREHGKCV